MPQNFRIAVQTDDLRLYYKLLRIFEGSRLKPRFFTPNQTIPSHHFDLIVTTEELIDNLHEPPILQLKSTQIQSNLIARIISIIARRNDPKFKLLVVGIDPGKHIGLAAICDGMVLAAETSKLVNLAAKIEEYLILFPSEMVVIRIGNQPTYISRVVFNKLFTVFGNINNINLEIVEEAYSSVRKTTSAVPFGSDETAAITIAYRTGKVKNHLVRSNIPTGRIKEIQKWSRNLSNNRITLDAELAQSVALGEISLEEAIIQKERQLEAKKNE